MYIGITCNATFNIHKLIIILNSEHERLCCIDLDCFLQLESVVIFYFIFSSSSLFAAFMYYGIPIYRLHISDRLLSFEGARVA